MPTLIEQPSVREVQAAVLRDQDTIRLVIKDDQGRTEMRQVLVTSVTVYRGTNAITFTGKWPRQNGPSTEYWDITVRNFTEDPMTASYSESFFFI